jgi:Proteasome subunit/Proteasome subunit A N-terminal signature
VLQEQGYVLALGRVCIFVCNFPDVLFLFPITICSLYILSCFLPCVFQYDLSTTTFSPDGRVFQVEYATKAVEKSGTVIGVRCLDGVVLGVEKVILSRMLLRSSNRRIHSVDRHSGMAVAGLTADARQLVNQARDECVSYRSTYGMPISGDVLNNRMAYVNNFCCAQT